MLHRVKFSFCLYHAIMRQNIRAPGTGAMQIKKQVLGTQC